MGLNEETNAPKELLCHYGELQGTVDVQQRNLCYTTVRVSSITRRNLRTRRSLCSTDSRLKVGETRLAQDRAFIKPTEDPSS